MIGSSTTLPPAAVRLAAALSLAMLVVAATGCAKKKPQAQNGAAAAQTSDVAPGGAGASSGSPADATEPPRQVVAELGPVFFAFDRYDLAPAAVAQLDRNVEYLRQHPDLQVVVEGHCDEFGTNEYNLALGERRAGAARGYLAAQGIDPARLRTVSYGEERPFCPESHARCWELNRRAHFSAPGP